MIAVTVRAITVIAVRVHLIIFVRICLGPQFRSVFARLEATLSGTLDPGPKSIVLPRPANALGRTQASCCLPGLVGGSKSHS
jgi:hypothetical protein